MEIKLNEESFDGIIDLAVICPSCKNNMVAMPDNSAWTELDKLVVSPMICPTCQCTGSIQLHIAKNDETP